MDQLPDRLEFAVPDDIDIYEQPPERELFIDSDERPLRKSELFRVGPMPNPTLERLRRALASDHDGFCGMSSLTGLSTKGCERS